MTTFRIRPAAPRDHAAYLRLFPELGRADPYPTKSEWARRLMPTTFVLELEGRVVAYCLWSVRQRLRVVELVVERSWRGHGLGRRLLHEVAEHFRHLGVSEWEINVREGNASAIHLYESVGFRTHARWYELRVPWTAADELPRDSTLLRTSPVQPRELGFLERQFQLWPGTLYRRLKTTAGNVLLSLHTSAGALGGVAAFSPSFAQADPFCIRQIEWAGALIEGLAQYREPEDDAFLLTVEHEPLAAALHHAGATSVLTVLEMRGRIPGA
jgi:GNAT superfamily N-acetyltransferase